MSRIIKKLVDCLVGIPNEILCMDSNFFDTVMDSLTLLRKLEELLERNEDIYDSSGDSSDESTRTVEMTRSVEPIADRLKNIEDSITQMKAVLKMAKLETFILLQSLDLKEIKNILSEAKSKVFDLVVSPNCSTIDQKLMIEKASEFLFSNDDSSSSSSSTSSSGKGGRR
jgi:hypothetical protein